MSPWINDTEGNEPNLAFTLVYDRAHLAHVRTIYTRPAPSHCTVDCRRPGDELGLGTIRTTVARVRFMVARLPSP